MRLWPRLSLPCAGGSGDRGAKLVELGANAVEDPSARRLAAILPVSEAQVALFQPMMLPMWLELSALSLLTYGLSPARKPVSEPKVAAKRKRRRKATVKMRSGVVIPFARRAANEN
jgi:hypothetical protein